MHGVNERAWYLAGRAVAMALRALKLTLRFEVRHPERFRPPCILALWHGRIIGSTMFHADSRCVTMASQSKDGGLAAGAVDGLGLRTHQPDRSIARDPSLWIRTYSPVMALSMVGEPCTAVRCR